MSEDAHARPTRDAPESLYDVNIPTPTHAERARTLVAQISTGTLCTVALGLGRDRRSGVHFSGVLTPLGDPRWNDGLRS